MKQRNYLLLFLGATILVGGGISKTERNNKFGFHQLKGDIVNRGSNESHGERILGFQSETAEIYYRNIRIKEFDEIVSTKQFLN